MGSNKGQGAGAPLVDTALVPLCYSLTAVLKSFQAPKLQIQLPALDQEPCVESRITTLHRESQEHPIYEAVSLTGNHVAFIRSFATSLGTAAGPMCPLKLSFHYKTRLGQRLQHSPPASLLFDQQLILELFCPMPASSLTGSGMERNSICQSQCVPRCPSLIVRLRATSYLIHGGQGSLRRK